MQSHTLNLLPFHKTTYTDYISQQPPRNLLPPPPLNKIHTYLPTTASLYTYSYAKCISIFLLPFARRKNAYI